VRRRKLFLGGVSLFAGVVLASLSACDRPPTTLRDPPGSITMKPDSQGGSGSAAKETAQKHCESWDKNAVRAPASDSGNGTVTYLCR